MRKKIQKKKRKNISKEFVTVPDKIAMAHNQLKPMPKSFLKKQLPYTSQNDTLPWN